MKRQTRIVNWGALRFSTLVGAWTGFVAALGEMPFGRALALVFVASLAASIWTTRDILSGERTHERPR